MPSCGEEEKTWYFEGSQDIAQVVTMAMKKIMKIFMDARNTIVTIDLTVAMN